MAIATRAPPFSLRKACQTCTRRKRKCIVELPRCQRCRQRNLDCVYDLEPLVTAKATSSASASTTASASASSIGQRRRKNRAQHQTVSITDATEKAMVVSPAARSFLDYITSLHISANIYAYSLVNRALVHSLTAVPLTQDPEAVLYIVGEMRWIPDLVREGKVTPFVHPSMSVHCHRRKTKNEQEEQWTSNTGWFCTDPEDPDLDLPSEFILPDPTIDMPLVDMVSITQRIILFLIEHAFVSYRPHTSNPPPPPPPTPAVQAAFTLLQRWRTHLWQHAFSSPRPTALSAWHTWLLEESLRRTILMSYLVEGTFSAWRRGWCCHRLFVYALPFNMHRGLWTARSEREWEARCRAGAGEDQGRKMLKGGKARELTSMKEFTCGFAAAPFEPGEDLFQKLLLVSHHGRRPVEERLGRLKKSVEASGDEM